MFKNKTQLPSPVFIVGAARSGTTAISTALKEGAGYEGGGEGHLLQLLGEFNLRITNYYQAKKPAVDSGQCLISFVDQEDLKQAIRNVFRDLCNTIFNKKAWFDKTPDHLMIRACHELSLTWPEARFIFAKRRGIENILSRTRKFPHLTFDQKCEEWAACMQEWVTQRNLLNGNFLEIDQMDLLQKPLDMAKQLVDYLSLGDDKVSDISNIFTNKRPEQTTTDQKSTAISLSETGWSDQEVSIFRNKCSETMRLYGYSEIN